MDSGVIVPVVVGLIAATASVIVARLGKRVSVVDAWNEIRSLRKDLNDSEEAADVKRAADRRVIINLSAALALAWAHITRTHCEDSLPARDRAIIEKALEIEPHVPQFD